MNTISILSTTHRDNGLANSKNLYSILLNINPELVFIELPKNQYADYFTKLTLKTLETDAINAFRKHKKIEVILVDSTAADIGMFKEIDFLFENIHSISQHLDVILEHIHTYTFQYGFPYLNSNKFYEHLTAQKEEEQKTVNRSNNHKLIELYEMWNDINSQRETDMLNNIQGYTTKHSFNNAVFLVGSAHSHSIIKKAEATEFQLNIELYNFTEEASAAYKNA